MFGVNLTWIVNNQKIENFERSQREYSKSRFTHMGKASLRVSLAFFFELR